MTRKILFTILMILFLASLSFSQEKNNEYIVSNSSSSACETNPVYFAEISNVVNHTKQNIFAIFRAGKNETEIVNAKRLVYVKTFLQKRRDWSKFVYCSLLRQDQFRVSILTKRENTFYGKRQNLDF